MHASAPVAEVALPSPGDLEERHLAWLIDGPVRGPDGAVRSWANPVRPGFDYAEAAGLLLSLHAEAVAREARRDLLPDGHRLAAWLRHRIAPRGAVGHRGVRYAFDTAVVAAALDRWSAAAGGPDGSALRPFLRRCLADGVGQRGAEDDGHWSRAFGPHLLKLALALPGEPVVADLARRMVRECWDGAWFRTVPGSAAVYPHAHAYALEGLIALRSAGLPIAEGVIEAGVRSLLASLGSDAHTSDVVAQAARLALLTGHDAGAALELLADRAAPGGGLRYAPGSPDVNSWATVFGVQALRWARLGAAPGWLA